MKRIPTVLEKCGISNEIVRFLRIKGLVVPKKVKETEDALLSPSEKWFQAVADKFTPKLSYREREAMKRVPFLLSLKIINSEHVAIDTAFVLYEALKKISELKDVKEKVAALLAILRIFHATLDYNILKYDRHLEYYEYEESPVGYIYRRFRELLFKVAPKNADREKWIIEKSLQLLATPKRVHFTQEYYFACMKVQEMLKEKIPNIHDLTLEGLLNNLKNDPVFDVIEEIAYGFYKKPEEFIRDVLELTDLETVLKRIRENKIKSRRALEEVCSNLSEQDAFELERIVEILEEFISIQEWEGSFGGGVHFRGKFSFWVVLFKAYEMLKSLLKENEHLINPRADRNEITELLYTEDTPNIFVINRKILMYLEKYFTNDVIRIYNHEMERWIVYGED